LFAGCLGQDATLPAAGYFFATMPLGCGARKVSRAMRMLERQKYE
jgi:hypothetical protein